MAQIASDLEKNHTGRKLSTMAIRLGFLIEIFFHIIFYRDSHTNPYIFVGHTHTELGAPVMTVDFANSNCALKFESLKPKKLGKMRFDSK